MTISKQTPKSKPKTKRLKTSKNKKIHEIPMRESELSKKELHKIVKEYCINQLSLNDLTLVLFIVKDKQNNLLILLNNICEYIINKYNLNHNHIDKIYIETLLIRYKNHIKNLPSWSSIKENLNSIIIALYYPILSVNLSTHINFNLEELYLLVT